MQFLEMARQVIPGYDLLSPDQQGAFQQTDVGRRFEVFVNDFIKPVESALENTTGLWGFFSIISGSQESKKDQLRQSFLSKRQAFIAEIAESEDYKALINQIVFSVLEQEFSDFSLLTPSEKSQLARAEFSKSLQSEFIMARSAYEAERQKISPFDPQISSGWLEQLKEQKESILNQWYLHFCEDQDMAPLRERIAVQRAPQRANALAGRLPILSTSSSTQYSRSAYIAAYLAESKKVSGVDFDLMEETFLTSMLQEYLQKATLKRINSIDLKDFNLKWAKHIAKKIQGAIAEDKSLKIAHWLSEYQTKLAAHIQKKLRQTNDRSRRVAASSGEDPGMLSSLSYHFWHSGAVRNTTEFVNKLADAHAFIQYTGMSTQNESSFLAMIDIYNYYRSADQIKETRSILHSLSTPFLPLYQEYKEIGLYEKNVYRKIFRTAMPLLIIAGVVVLIAALLAPLGIPELAFLVVAIPAVMLGAFLASKYVTLKNELYQYLRNKWYGGPYEIPEFQVNDRMRELFNSEEDAEIIRGIYLEELKACDELDRGYCAREGLLTEVDLELRKQNIAKRHGILLEWYDIHSNNNLGIDKARQLVTKRFIDIFDEEATKMEKALNRDSQQASQCAKDIVDEVRAVLSVASPSYAATSTETSSEPRKGIKVTQVSAADDKSGLRFFESLVHRERAKKVDCALLRFEQASMPVSVR